MSSRNYQTENTPPPKPKSARTQRQLNNWTIMVYLAGDNNLSEEMVYALKSMQLVGSKKPDYEVVALYEGGIAPVTLEIEQRETLLTGVPPLGDFMDRAERVRRAEANQRIKNAE